ncbi:MAG: ABC transporter substrate-binding protein [Actinomycetota bacterium]
MGSRVAAMALAAALVAAACSDDSSDETVASTTTAPTTTAAVPTTTEPPAENGTGVTDDAIRLGFIGIDFDVLREAGLVDINWGDYELVVETFVDELNARGGINGRLIEAHIEQISPVDAAGADEVCLRFTEDIEVFAVIGAFTGPTASANPCFTTDGDTILVGGSATPEERAKATAPWITTTAGVERHLPAAVRLLHDAGWIGDRVGVAWDQTEQSEADLYILPALADVGVTPVNTFVQGTEGGDAVEGQSEWQVISERVALDEIDTMILTEVTGIFGLQQLLANGYDGQLLVVDTLGNTGAIGAAEIVPLDQLGGIIGTGFLDTPETWQQEASLACIDLFETGQPDITVVPSDEVAEGEPSWGVNIGGVCNGLRIFEQAATAAGPTLNHDTFLDGIHQIGEFEIMGRGTGFLGEGRYDAANEIRIVEFDTEDLPDGGSKPAGPMTPIDEILG